MLFFVLRMLLFTTSIPRLKEGLRPILTRLKTRKSQLNSLEVEVLIFIIIGFVYSSLFLIVGRIFGALSSPTQVDEKKKVLEVVRRKIDTSEEILRCQLA